MSHLAFNSCFRLARVLAYAASFTLRDPVLTQTALDITHGIQTSASAGLRKSKRVVFSSATVSPNLQCTDTVPEGVQCHSSVLSVVSHCVSGGTTAAVTLQRSPKSGATFIAVHPRDGDDIVGSCHCDPNKMLPEKCRDSTEHDMILRRVILIINKLISVPGFPQCGRWLSFIHDHVAVQRSCRAPCSSKCLIHPAVECKHLHHTFAIRLQVNTKIDRHRERVRDGQ